MDDISRDIELYSSLRAQAAFNRSEAVLVSAKADEIMRSVQARIKGGETTGDRIKDFVIAYYCVPNEEIETAFREIDVNLIHAAGEFVLAIMKEEERFADGDPVLKTRLYLGVLNSGGLVLDIFRDRCGLPTANHVYADSFGKCIELRPGDYFFGWKHDIAVNLNKPLELSNPLAQFSPEQDLRLEIKIGDAEVRTWFNNKRDTRYYLTLFQKMAEMLGRPDAVKSPKS